MPAQSAARIEPKASFGITLEVDGRPERFINLSMAVGSRGPSSYVSEPRLLVLALYPQDLDLSGLIDPALDNPLLCEHALMPE